MKFISIQAQMAKVQKIKLVLIFYKEFYFLNPLPNRSPLSRTLNKVSNKPDKGIMNRKVSNKPNKGITNLK